MPLFAAGLSCVVLLLAFTLALAGKSQRAKFAQTDGALVARHPDWLKWFMVLGYCIISAIPLAFAGQLREGDPLMDRALFLLIHGAFLVGILMIWNQSVVIGERQVVVSTMFGAVRVIDSADLAGARIERHRTPLPGTVFVTPKGAIWVDDEMQNGEQVVAALKGRAGAAP